MTREQRALVIARDRGRCVCCGHPVEGRRFSVHHRKLRSQGGLDDPTNLILLLGDGAQGHHHQAHTQREMWGIPNGYIVESWRDPATVPVRYYRRGWVLLTSTGSLVEVDVDVDQDEDDQGDDRQDRDQRPQP